MSEDEKLIKVEYAPGYTGWATDLGDGTCRLENDPLMGANGPNCGDRVDLFYPPCGRMSDFYWPRIGYRIYPEGVEPVGRNFAARPMSQNSEVIDMDEFERDGDRIDEKRDAAILREMKQRDEEIKRRVEILRLREVGEIE